MNLLKVLYDTIYYTSPILLCTFGGFLGYKANLINIGLEGIMGFGGLGAALGVLYFASSGTGLLLGGLSGAFFGLVFAWFSISRGANFIITGFGINLLALAAGKYVIAIMNETSINLITVPGMVDRQIRLPVVSNIPVLNEVISGHSLVTYLSFSSVLVMYVLMYKTRFGTYVRIVGENEDAAISVGIKVKQVKYAAVVLGAVLAGLAGFNVAVEQIKAFTPMFTNGIGFIAIAAIFCGHGRLLLSGAYALLFGFSNAIAINLGLVIGDSAILFRLIPYLTIVVVLMVVGVARRVK